MEKLEMQDLKKNIEPILVKIKKRQYKSQQKFTFE